MNFPLYVSRKTCRQKQKQSEDGAVRKSTDPLVFHCQASMPRLPLPSPRQISAFLLSQPMTLTTCSYKIETWRGRYGCSNRRAIAFDECRDGVLSVGVRVGWGLSGRPPCPSSCGTPSGGR